MQMTFQLDLRTMIEFSLLIAGPFDLQQSIIHTYELDFFRNELDFFRNWTSLHLGRRPTEKEF